jgi:hypothetical protein
MPYTNGAKCDMCGVAKAALGNWDRMFVREVQPKRKAVRSHAGSSSAACLLAVLAGPAAMARVMSSAVWGLHPISTRVSPH